MRGHRLFFAIEIPEALRRKLSLWIEGCRELPVRWVRDENLHITVSFLGHVHDREMVRIATDFAEYIRAIPCFSLLFSRIVLAPSPERPRMIWHEGEPCEELGMLVDALTHFSCSDSPDVMPPRPLHPHITLGRLKQERWYSLPHAPAIHQELHAQVPVSSVALMESELGPQGPTYVILQSAPLSEGGSTP